MTPLEWDSAKEFCGGLSRVKKGNKLGFINRLGGVVIPLRWDDAFDFTEGLAVIGENTKRERRSIIDTRIIERR